MGLVLKQFFFYFSQNMPVFCQVKLNQYSGRDIRSSEPCPSETCWTYNPLDQKCILKPSNHCLTLICRKDYIEISFISALFATSDNLLFADERMNATLDEETNRWKIKCKLGDCGMTAKTVKTLEDENR